jgi:hypothetical protein
MNLQEAKNKLLLLLRDNQKDIRDGIFSDILWQNGFSVSHEMTMKLYRESKMYKNIISVVLWNGYKIVLVSAGYSHAVWEIK